MFANNAPPNMSTTLEPIVEDILSAQSLFEIDIAIAKLSLTERDHLFSNHALIQQCTSNFYFSISSYFFEYFNDRPLEMIPCLSDKILLQLYHLYIKNTEKTIYVYAKKIFLSLAYHCRDQVCIRIAEDEADRSAILCACLQYGLTKTAKRILTCAISQNEFENKFWKYIHAVTGTYQPSSIIYDYPNVRTSKKVRTTKRRIKKSAAPMLLYLIRRCSPTFLQTVLSDTRWNIFNTVVRCVHTVKSLKILLNTPTSIYESNIIHTSLQRVLTTKWPRHILYRAYSYSSLDVICLLEKYVKKYSMLSEYNECSAECLLGLFNNPNFKVFSSVFEYHRDKIPLLLFNCHMNINPEMVMSEIFSTHVPAKYQIKKIQYLNTISSFPNEFIDLLFVYANHKKMISFLLKEFPSTILSDAAILNCTYYNDSCIPELQKRAKYKDVIWLILLQKIKSGYLWNSEKVQTIFSYIQKPPYHTHVLYDIKMHFEFIHYEFIRRGYSSSQMHGHYMDMYKDCRSMFPTSIWKTKRNTNHLFVDALLLLGVRVQEGDFIQSSVYHRMNMSQRIHRCLKQSIRHSKKLAKESHRKKMENVHREYSSLPPNIYSSLPNGNIDYQRALNRFQQCKSM